MRQLALTHFPSLCYSPEITNGQTENFMFPRLQKCGTQIMLAVVINHPLTGRQMQMKP